MEPYIRVKLLVNRDSEGYVFRSMAARYGTFQSYRQWKTSRLQATTWGAMQTSAALQFKFSPRGYSLNQVF